MSIYSFAFVLLCCAALCCVLCRPRAAEFGEKMVDVETAQRGGGPRWENGNTILDDEENMDAEDLESNSAKLFERSRIKALAGWFDLFLMLTRLLLLKSCITK